jgi:hypothetical protein
MIQAKSGLHISKSYTTAAFIVDDALEQDFPYFFEPKRPKR